MRRTIVFSALAVFTLGLTGASAQAMSSGPDVTFEVWCDEAGIEAEGRIAGWLGMMLVESGEGVSAGSVGVLWSFTQETWQDTGPKPGFSMLVESASSANTPRRKTPLVRRNRLAS